MTTLAKISNRCVLLFAIALLSTTAIAQSYTLTALGDLRAAHWLIDQGRDSGQITGEQTTALHAIEFTVSEIIAADIDDGKYYKDRPDIVDMDTRDQAARLHRAAQLLLNAQNDLQNEPSAAIRPLKARMLGHIADALRLIEKSVASK